MGLDAIITVKGDLTEAPHRFTFDCHIGLSEDGTTEEISVYGAWADEGRFEFTLDRYWSKEYPRGDWPNIYALIRACQVAWPKATIWYSSDLDNPGEEQECTTHFLETQWQDWTSMEANFG